MTTKQALFLLILTLVIGLFARVIADTVSSGGEALDPHDIFVMLTVINAIAALACGLNLLVNFIRWLLRLADTAAARREMNE